MIWDEMLLIYTYTTCGGCGWGERLIMSTWYVGGSLTHFLLFFLLEYDVLFIQSDRLTVMARGILRRFVCLACTVLFLRHIWSCIPVISKNTKTEQMHAIYSTAILYVA